MPTKQMDERRSLRLRQRNGSRHAVLLPPHVWSQFAYFRLLMQEAGGQDDADVIMSDDINCLLAFLKRRQVATIEECIVLFRTCEMLGLDENALLRGCMNAERARLAIDFASTPISNALCDIFVSSLPNQLASCTDLTHILNRSFTWRSLCLHALCMDPPLDPRNLSNLMRLYRDEPRTDLERSTREMIRSLCTGEASTSK